MTAQRVAMSYSLAVGTACPLAFGLGKVSRAVTLGVCIARRM